MKKLNNAKWFALGVVVTVIISMFAVPAFAKQGSENIEVTFRDIKISINGNVVTPTDASGVAVEPFLYNGTTYLPIRAIGNALGMEVGWNGDTNTATMTSPGGSAPKTSGNDLTFGDVFTFDGFEISFENKPRWTTVQNQYSDHYGSVVVGFPVSVKNNNDATELFNQFYCSLFGTKGTELSSVHYYFDDSVFEIGELRSGAQNSGYMYFLYDGDGDYYVEFNNFSSRVEIRIPVYR